MVSRLIHVHRLVIHLPDGIDRKQELRLAQTKEASGCHAEEAHLLLAIVNEQIVHVPDDLARFVKDAATSHILGRIGRYELAVANGVQ